MHGGSFLFDLFRSLDLDFGLLLDHGHGLLDVILDSWLGDDRSGEFLDAGGWRNGSSSGLREVEVEYSGSRFQCSFDISIILISIILLADSILS